ncbi:MAG: D-glycero-beta-D-manno-heptose 1-phosphate adenylyltransferase [Phycisphaerales bacterium]|nr:D-glycero-beta-D-manno-heptose 1-phosphate adenylyltransferase [Phycisphaerales bacterium]
MNQLLANLASWRPIRALVVGDFMLDQLIYGDAERLTGDAPVPILAARKTEQLPGGAANVCADLVAMHAHVTAFGVVGDDHDGGLLRKALTDGGIDTAGLVADPARPTTVKRSLIGLAQHRHPQKMFRVDFESREPIAAPIVDQLLERFDAALAQGVDVVAIEDYAKGVCTEATCQAIIERCKRAGIPVIVDPAFIEDYTRYRGCTSITPNRSEAELATGISTDADANADHNAQLAQALMQQLDCENVILTLDKHGALLLERSKTPLAIPTVARQVYDVTGAGDMVLAALCAARANKLTWPDAVRFANAAAGLEVEVFGVKPMPFERIYQSILRQSGSVIGKRRTLEQALIEVKAARREGHTIVFTNGCFDILHAGHIRLLREARKFGDLLVVGLNTDASVQRLKGDDRPVHNEDDRAAVLSELEAVALVVLFDEDTPTKLIETLQPNVLVKGGDYTKDKVIGHDLVQQWGGRVELVPVLEGRSTTGAIEKVRAK